MAVFTAVSPAQAQDWLERYPVGRLTAIEGIASGIENSNFFVDTIQGRFVLTLFERLSANDLPFYLGLMKHLADRGIACPAPITDREGRLFGTLCGKPAALVTRLSGQPCMTPSAQHCTEIGRLLAQMHLAGHDYAPVMPNTRGRNWWEAAASEVRGFLDESALQLLDSELEAQRAFAASAQFEGLQAGAVHADLFRDNVLFASEAASQGTQLSGVIDFYFACTDHWLYDLAVTVNDWCIDDAGGRLDRARLDALLAAYGAIRPLPETERECWPMMLRAAAFRFWLSRLHDFHLPRPAQMVKPKDPAHFERILRLRRECEGFPC
jgi:homoserine kinase type II